jgi:hypothetical protein
MPNVKAQVLADIKARIKLDLEKVHIEINSNRSQIKKLAERQWVLKREVSQLFHLMNSFTLKENG